MIRAYINATTKAVTRAVIPGSGLKQNTMSVLKNDDYVYLRTSFSETEDLIQKLFVGTAYEAFSPAYTTSIIM